jgi:hypothetical protein
MRPRTLAGGIQRSGLPTTHVNSSSVPLVTTAFENALSRISLWQASRPPSGKCAIGLKFHNEAEPSDFSNQSLADDIIHQPSTWST